MVFSTKKKPEPKINDLIFKELIKRGYSLEGNTRVWNIADSKLWYLTPEQSQAYLDLEGSSEYTKAVNQDQGENLLNSNADEILSKLGTKFNIVDLGCGDGGKAATLIKTFKKIKPSLKIRYCPIDISGYMVKKAMETFSKLDVEEVIDFQYNISDFENLENITPLLRKDDFNQNLFLLLGNTLGNFEINELLYEIRSAMKEKDILVIDTAIADKDIEEKTRLHSKNEKVNNFLSHIPHQLGLNKEDIEYGARWRNWRVEFYYTIKKEKVINFQGKKVTFNIGDQIIVAIAYKHDKHDLKTYLNMHFRDAEVIFSADKAQALAICIH